jgi:hypothetical protein
MLENFFCHGFRLPGPIGARKPFTRKNGLIYYIFKKMELSGSETLGTLNFIEKLTLGVRK